jgi:hypothetical protein
MIIVTGAAGFGSDVTRQGALVFTETGCGNGTV